MEVCEVLPQLRMFRFEVGQAYAWRDGDEVTLIDTATAGSEGEILEAAAPAGSGLRIVRIVLTHFHADHVGSAAALREATGAEVVAHRIEAPVIRGDVSPPEPVITEAERPLFERVTAQVPPAPPCPVEVEVDDDALVRFGGGARVVHVPGHTPGSIAIYLSRHRVLFTGDNVASVGGEPILGPFNLDRKEAIASFERLASLDAEVACFGHGDPIVSAAAARLRFAALRVDGTGWA